MSTKTLTEQLGKLRVGNMKALCQLGEALVLRGEDAVLICLYQQGQPVPSGQLVEKTGLTTGRIANILKSLEQKGSVTRLADQADRRRVLVTLTEDGRAMAEQLLQDDKRQTDCLLEHLGEADGAELLRMLERCLSFFREDNA